MNLRLMKSILVVALIFNSMTAMAKSKKPAHAKSPKTTVFEVKDEQTVVLNTSDVSEASVTTSGKGDENAAILIELKSKAAKRFAEYTKKHIGQTLTILIDGKEVSSPKIMDEIEGGHLMVDAKMTTHEADAIADRINAH
jgi:preprotein translocase subunit SecD